MFFLFEPPTAPGGQLPEKEPEDIFAATEPPAVSKSAPASPAVKPPVVIETPPPVIAKAPLISSRKTMIVLGVIVGLIILGGVGYGLARFLRQAQTSPEASAPTPSAMEPEAVIPSTVAPTPEQEAPLIPEAPPVGPIDTDGDGLSDEEETAMGTKIDEPDSDSDGLFDFEEVKTYQTDPNNVDTDGDTYNDGTEVRNGYNPKGEGRLVEIPTE